MIFNSFQFIVVFPLIFLLYYVIPVGQQKVRNLYLLAISYLLYLNWKPVHAVVLLGVTIVTFFVGQAIEKRRDIANRIMSVGILVALIPLILFKYYNFINEGIWGILEIVGIRFSLPGLNWAIPVGISFFTFQAIGYVWDVYYNRIRAEHDFLCYALFISFFPSIVSGPINKASLVIPQLKNLRPYFDYVKAVGGGKMLLWGMFMKVVVADRVALYVDTILPNYMHYTGMTCFFASILYTIQIYADFAGYSLMAIGVGKLLGFELTENFKRPYFSYSITEFWHRWHISLSTWLKDYIYIPLGGSRCSRKRNYFNILITFLVSGIWHGANCTFMVWGGFHGLAQVIEKMIGQQNCNYGMLGRTIKIIITFLLVNFAWIFFRMPTLRDGFGAIQRIFNPSLPRTIFSDSITTMALILFAIATLFIKDAIDEFFPTAKRRMIRYALIRWSFYLFVMVSILLTGVFGADQFIYANF